MRLHLWVCVLLGCGGSHLDPPREPEWAPPIDAAVAIAPTVHVAPPIDAAPDPDPDRDRIVGACDLCPNEPETYNGIVDEDGCPDSSGTSHAVIEHPTNRYGSPTTVAFAGTSMTLSNLEYNVDDDVEAIEVIGRASATVSHSVAVKRAAAVAKVVRFVVARIAKGTRVTERVSAATPLYVGDDAPDVSGDVFVQVMRAGGVDIWRWDGDHLVRATPRRTLPVPKLPAGC